MTLIIWVSSLLKISQNPKTGGFLLIVKKMVLKFLWFWKFLETIATGGFLISKLFKSSKQEVVNKTQSTNHPQDWLTATSNRECSLFPFSPRFHYLYRLKKKVMCAIMTVVCLEGAHAIPHSSAVLPNPSNPSPQKEWPLLKWKNLGSWSIAESWDFAKSYHDKDSSLSKQ